MGGNYTIIGRFCASGGGGLNLEKDWVYFEKWCKRIQQFKSPNHRSNQIGCDWEGKKRKKNSMHTSKKQKH